MKNIIRSILRTNNKPHPRNEVCTHKKTNISQDQINKSLIFLSQDHCKSCNEHMCNICSDSHIIDHCHLSCKKHLILVGVKRDVGSGIEKDFNYGYLMKVSL